MVVLGVLLHWVMGREYDATQCAPFPSRSAHTDKSRPVREQSNNIKPMSRASYVQNAQRISTIPVYATWIFSLSSDGMRHEGVEIGITKKGDSRLHQQDQMIH